MSDWTDALLYHVYVRSFQDTDGDGVGDLRGIERRLDHVEALGADAIWLAPISPSPLVDFGYDVSNFTDVDPALGTLEDFDRRVASAHRRNLRVIFDLVVGHTAIEHPWFREHPDWYVWADGHEPPNNWLASFGGLAWTRDAASGRWYHHAFYPGQPSLNWRNPELVAAMQDVVRFWRGRGVDGFRLDALEQLTKDPLLRNDPPTREGEALAAFAIPRDYYDPAYLALEHLHSRDTTQLGGPLRALRQAAGDAFMIGEVIEPASTVGPLLRWLDSAICFDFLFAPPEAEPVKRAVASGTAAGNVAWVRSNHDFARLPTIAGERTRAMLLLMLALPGPAILYQGDELGQPEGPGTTPRLDQAGRDRLRHPMRWDDTPEGGFTTGIPWLPMGEDREAPASAQARDPASTWHFVRRTIAERKRLSGPAFVCDSQAGTVVFRRACADGERVIAANLSDEPRQAPPAGRVEASTHDREGRVLQVLEPGEGFVARSA